MKNNTKGIIYVLTAAIVFSLGGLLIKLINLSALAIASGRCIFSSLVFLIYFLVTKRKLVINKTTILGCALGLLNMLCYIVSNKLTTAANAIILEYTSSIFIIVFELIFFNKKPKRLDIIASLIVLFGIVLVFVDGIQTSGVIGIIVALIGGMIYGLVLMANSFEGGDSLSSMFMAHVLCAFIFMPKFIGEIANNFGSFSYLLILGVVQAGMGYLCISIGTKYCKPLTASLIASIEPILNPILVAIFASETMNPLGIVGASIVIITIIIYNYLSTKTN